MTLVCEDCLSRLYDKSETTSNVITDNGYEIYEQKLIALSIQSNPY